MQETIGEKILPIDEGSLVNNVQIDDKTTWRIFENCLKLTMMKNFGCLYY